MIMGSSSATTAAGGRPSGVRRAGGRSCPTENAAAWRPPSAAVSAAPTVPEWVTARPALAP